MSLHVKYRYEFGYVLLFSWKILSCHALYSSATCTCVTPVQHFTRVSIELIKYQATQLFE